MPRFLHAAAIFCLLLPASSCLPQLRTPSARSRHAKYEQKVFLGFDAARHGDTCVAMVAFLQAPFFDGLERKETSHGAEFKTPFGVVTDFPDRFLVEINARVVACSENIKLYDPPAADPAFAFMRSLSFDAVWKRGLDSRPVLCRSPQRIATPPESNPGDFWRYQVDICDRDVPLTDSLVITLNRSGGAFFGRFSARL